MDVEVRILDPRVQKWGFPQYGSAQAAGLDLYACIEKSLVIAPQSDAVLVPTGIAVHIADPEWSAIVIPRSGQGHEKGLVLGNTIGLVDSDYTGQCFISLWNRNSSSEPKSAGAITISPGDRIAQLVLIRVIRPQWVPVTTFSRSTKRGESGFGSTGNNSEKN